VIDPFTDSHKDQRMPLSKSERSVVEKLLSCLDGRVEVVTDSKEELIDAVKALSADWSYIFSNSSMPWNRGRVLTELKILSEDGWREFLSAWRRQQAEHDKEQELADGLLARLEERFPDEDFYIVELVRYTRKDLGIKMEMCGGTYLFEHHGTLNQLVEDLSREVEARRRDLVTSPFCKETKPRHHWYDQEECPCGAPIVRATTREYKAGKWHCPLADQMRHEKRAVSVGRGMTNYEMWFLRPS
jgi:hypothetical protein